MAGKGRGKCSQSYLSNFKLDLETFQELRRNNGQFCDVLLKSSGGIGRVPCHRVVLYAASPFFREQLAGHRDSEMTLDSIQLQYLKILIDYIYSGETEINLSPENVFNIFDGARVLKLGKLEADCVGYVRKLVRPGQATEALESVEVLVYNEGLVDSCINVILKGFEDGKSSGLDNLSFGIMERIVGKGVGSRRPLAAQMLQAITEWMEKKLEERKAHASLLIKDIPLGNLHPNFLKEIFREKEYLRNNPEVFDLYLNTVEEMAKKNLEVKNGPKCPSGSVEETSKSGGKSKSATGNQAKRPSAALSANVEERVGENALVAGPSKRRRAAAPPPACPGQSGNVPAKMIYYMAPTPTANGIPRLVSLDLETLSESENGMTGSRGTTIHLECREGSLYRIVSVESLRGFLPVLGVCDLKTRVWLYNAISSTYMSSTDFKSIILGEYVYVMGGEEGLWTWEGCLRFTLNRVGRLPLGEVGNADRHLDQVASMQDARAGFGVAVVDGKIFVIGGTVIAASVGDWSGSEGRRTTTEMERYDPVLDNWQRCSPMPSVRSDFAVAVVSGCIYVVGGCGEDRSSEKLATVDVYDAKTNQWRSGVELNIPCMQNKRKSFHAVSFNHYIYALGGDGDNGGGGTIERFDLKKRTWDFIGPWPASVEGVCVQE